MRNHQDDPSRTALLLPTDSGIDYLAQWLAILADHFPGTLTAPAVLAYRLALGDLTNQQLDLAFSKALRDHPTSFRPTAGELRGYLRDARMQAAEAEAVALPPAPPMTDSEAREFLTQLRERVPALRPRQDAVLEITDEMRAEAKRKATEAERRHRERSA